MDRKYTTSIKWLLLGAAVLVTLLVTVHSLNDDESQNEREQEYTAVEIDETRIKVLSRSCMSCHGVDLRGIPGDGPSLRNIGLRYTKEEIREILVDGRNNGRMPKGLLEGGQAQEGDLEMMVEWLSQLE
jgi:mono/diheme cytochrome c family protein